MKNPYHVYWGRERGVVVTREPREEGGRPEVAFSCNQISLDQLKAAGAILLAGLFILWQIHRMMKKARRAREERRAKRQK